MRASTRSSSAASKAIASAAATAKKQQVSKQEAKGRAKKEVAGESDDDEESMELSSSEEEEEQEQAVKPRATRSRQAATAAAPAKAVAGRGKQAAASKAVKPAAPSKTPTRTGAPAKAQAESEDEESEEQSGSGSEDEDDEDGSDASGSGSDDDDQEGGQEEGSGAASRGGHGRDARAAKDQGASKARGGAGGRQRGGKGGAAAGAAAGSKRSFAEMVAGKVNDEAMKQLYRTLPRKRLVASQELQACLAADWPRWHLLLRAGFSLLLHGLGSKRELMAGFARDYLGGSGKEGAGAAEPGAGVLMLNGYLPSLTPAKVMSAVASQLLGRSVKGSVEDLLALVRRETAPEAAQPSSNTAAAGAGTGAKAKGGAGAQAPGAAAQAQARRVYVILNNIDGPGLRTEEGQALLSQLAACPGVHLVASIDHVNAPLMWSRAVEARFQWQYIDATTYCPYLAETMDMTSVLAGCFHQARQQGAGAVLGVLPANAREVYALLVGHQLEDPESEGLDFKLLFRMCRERFLLTSEPALRSHLTEFLDHELLATRAASDGSGEVMYVPMERAGLEKVMAELEALKQE